MKTNSIASHCRGAALGASALFLGLGQIATAAHTAANDVGRWNGFAHQFQQTVAGSPITLDLALASGSNRILTGSVSGLPAVASTLNATGAVTSSGTLVLVLSATGGYSGTLEGRVSNLAGFTHDGEPENFADLAFNVKTPTGTSKGHLNLLHLYGGSNWSTVVAPNLVGSAQGAALTWINSVAVDGGATVSAEVGSGLLGTMSIGEHQYSVVGTVSNEGSLIFLGDGIERPDPTKAPASVGMVFAGAIALNLSGPAEAVGHFHQGYFGTILPSSQTDRPGAMSLNWGTGS